MLITGGVLAAITGAVITSIFGLISTNGHENPTPTVNSLLLPTATCCAVPSPTATPDKASLQLNAVTEKCRTSGFSDGSGSSYVAVAFGEGSCKGITMGWSVPNAGGYAGCVVDLPSEILPLSNFAYLLLRAEGLRGSEQFQIGLINDTQDPVKQHKDMERVPPEGASQPIEISLDRFIDQNTTLESLNQLVFGINYDVGEGLRDSSICITEISFVPG